jgi:hypothetical protein
MTGERNVIELTIPGDALMASPRPVLRVVSAGDYEGAAISLSVAGRSSLPARCSQLPCGRASASQALAG